MEFFILLLFILGAGSSSPPSTTPPFPAPQPIPPQPIPSPVPAPPPATSPPATAPAPPPADLAHYIIKSGDTPFGLARRFVNDGARHKELLPVNPELKVVNTRDDDGKIIATHYVPFNPGQVLNVPPSWPPTPAT